MSEHPIEGLMTTAMNSIQDMIDVNTIIGEPIETSNNVVVIPISKVSFGFAAGGSEFRGETIDEYSRKDKEEEIQYRLPFGGGSGAGVSINPIAFLVIQPEGVKLLPVNYASAVDKLIDYVPDVMEKVNTIINKMMKEPKENPVNKIEYQSIKTKDIKKKNRNENEEKQIKTKPKRTKTSINKPEMQEPITTEYEYNETEQEDLSNAQDYTNYSDEYDD